MCGKLRSRSCSKKTLASLWQPVLQLVVSKHIPWNLSLKFQSFRTEKMALACDSPVPDGSFGIARSCACLLVVTSTGSLFTLLVPVYGVQHMHFMKKISYRLSYL